MTARCRCDGTHIRNYLGTIVHHGSQWAYVFWRTDNGRVIHYLDYVGLAKHVSNSGRVATYYPYDPIRDFARVRIKYVPGAKVIRLLR